MKNGCDIAAAVAVVRRAPYGNELRVEHVFEALLHELVAPADERQAVDGVEFRRDQRAEEPSCTTRGHAPGLNLLGVGPHQVAEGALVRNLAEAVNRADLLS